MNDKKQTYLIGGVEVTELKELKMPMMKDHVLSLGKDDVQWLVDTMKTTYPNEKAEDGTRKITFIEIRNAFAKKYCPAIAPKKAPKKEVLKDTLSELEAFLNE